MSVCLNISVLGSTAMPREDEEGRQSTITVDRRPSSSSLGQEKRKKPKLQALVYDILPSTTAVFSYATGPRKLSADEWFVVGAQTVVARWLQTTQIKQGVSFIAANKVHTSTNKTTIV